MTTISELVEEKRKELGESAREFVKRFPGKHTSNCSVYSKFKDNRYRSVPKAWVSTVAKLLGMPREDVQDYKRVEKKRIEAEAREKMAAEGIPRAQLIVAFAYKFKNQFSTRLIMSLFRVDHGGVCLEGYKYEYRDWNFHALFDAMLVELGIDSRNPPARKQTVREIIDSTGKDEAAKLALAISAYGICGYVYTNEEMPELHRIQWSIF